MENKSKFLNEIKVSKEDLEQKCNTHTFLPSYYSSLYNLLKSNKYIEFTDLVFSTIGSEIERFFPDIKTELVYRTKSQSSYNNKTSVHHDLIDNNPDSSNTQIFDTYGMKLVVNDVPINTELIHTISKDLLNKKLELQSNNSNKSIDELKSKIEEIKYLKNIYDTRLNTSKELRKIKRKYNQFVEKDNILAQKHYEDKIKLYNKQLENLKNKSEYYVAKYIFEYVLENSEKLNKLGITQIPKRRKSVDKENGYKAEHYGIKCKYLPHWNSEFQTKSSYRNLLATFGTASHDLGTTSHKFDSDSTSFNKIFINKQRQLPKVPSKAILSDKNVLKNYLKNDVLYFVPNFTIYIKDGGIHRFSDNDNFFHFYTEELVEQPSVINFYDNLLDKTNGMHYKPNFEKVFNKLHADQCEK